MNPSNLPLGLARVPEDKSVLETISRLQSYDFGPVSEDMKQKYGWPEEFCRDVERQVKQFLALTALDPKGAHAPNFYVDEFWHRMILHTRWYAEFCEKIFGRFIHHEVLSKRTVSSNDVGPRTKELFGTWFQIKKLPKVGLPGPGGLPFPVGFPHPTRPVSSPRNTTNCNNEPSCNTTNCNNEPSCNTTNCNNDA